MDISPDVSLMLANKLVVQTYFVFSYNVIHHARVGCLFQMFCVFIVINLVDAARL